MPSPVLLLLQTAERGLMGALAPQRSSEPQQWQLGAANEIRSSAFSPSA